MWYSWCQVSVVVKLKVSVFDATDPTDHGTVIATELMQFGAIWSPSFVTIEHSQANTGLAHLATYPRWEVSGDWDRQEFPELSPGHTTALACSPHPAEHTISADHQWFYTKGPDRILFYGQLGVSTQVMKHEADTASDLWKLSQLAMWRRATLSQCWHPLARSRSHTQRRADVGSRSQAAQSAT